MLIHEICEGYRAAKNITQYFVMHVNVCDEAYDEYLPYYVLN